MPVLTSGQQERKSSMEKLTPEKVYDIYREVSISKEKLQKILERIKAVL